MRLAAVVVAMLGVGLLAAPAAHAEDPIVGNVVVQAPDRLTVGDHVVYIIEVEADRGASVTLGAGGLPPVLTLTAPPRTDIRDISGSNRQLFTLNLELAPFAPGDLQIPPIALSYRAPDGATSTLRTQPTLLEVQSVLPATGEIAHRDLKPQEQVGVLPYAWQLPAAVSAAALAIVTLSFWLWQRRRMRRLAAAAAPVVVAEGPEDRARLLLDGAGNRFMTEADYVAYYGAIAETVRVYLTERFEFPAFALTTRELQECMVRSGVDRWQARLVAGLLTQCDSVVYASYRPAHERADADLTAAYEIVEMTRPVPEEEPEAVAT